MVVRLTLTYDGEAFGGWQRQINARSVQQDLEEALADLLGSRFRVVGASRTDAGVHARAQMCHFRLPRAFPLKGLVFGGNLRLPADVRIVAAHQMPDGFHARRCALGKEYAYRFVVGRVVSPLDRVQAAQLEFPPDLAAIRRALAFLPGRHDFSAFALSGGSHTHGRRRLFAARLDTSPGGFTFRFWGDGFLRGMVRALVGTLVEVGRGRRPPESLGELLREGRVRDEAGPTAEAKGLCLERVFYPPKWRPLDGYSALVAGTDGGLW